jgi:hypothetical protein
MLSVRLWLEDEGIRRLGHLDVERAVDDLEYVWLGSYLTFAVQGSGLGGEP